MSKEKLFKKLFPEKAKQLREIKLANNYAELLKFCWDNQITVYGYFNPKDEYSNITISYKSFECRGKIQNLEHVKMWLEAWNKVVILNYMRIGKE